MDCNNDVNKYIYTCAFMTPEKQKTLAKICDDMKIDKKEELKKLTAESVRDVLTENELQTFLNEVGKETTNSTSCVSSVNALIHTSGNSILGSVTFSNSAIAAGPNAKAMYLETRNTSELYIPLIEAKIPPKLVNEIIGKLKNPPFQIEYLDDLKEMDDKAMTELESTILPEGAQRKKFMRFVKAFVEEEKPK